jgi:D-glycero-D-manno-heptose 1,7-bisphosphate phosphatase
MLEQFRFNSIDITKVYYCPHSYEDNCECKKPKPGMILQAEQEFNIDLENSILIGDQNSDIEAGKNAGIKNLYLITTGHLINNTMNVPVLSSLSGLIH